MQSPAAQGATQLSRLQSDGSFRQIHAQNPAEAYFAIFSAFSQPSCTAHAISCCGPGHQQITFAILQIHSGILV